VHQRTKYYCNASFFYFDETILRLVVHFICVRMCVHLMYVCTSYVCVYTLCVCVYILCMCVCTPYVCVCTSYVCVCTPYVCVCTPYVCVCTPYVCMCVYILCMCLHLMYVFTSYLHIVVCILPLRSPHSLIFQLDYSLRCFHRIYLSFVLVLGIPIVIF